MSHHFNDVFAAGKNSKAHARLRRHEVDIRIETLARNIRFHENDPDRDRALNHMITLWRKELMELKLELSDYR